MLNTSFSPWPSFSDEEANAVRDVLLSNRVNQWTGEHVRAFEREFASYSGTQYAVAVANGTLALELCLRAIDLAQGDEVIVTPRTFLASASSIAIAGGFPVFADVDPHSQAITAETIEPLITEKTRAIIVVHLGGYPADLDPIMDLAAENNLVVIEDCAQAHGARYKNRSVGSIGHLGAWSFCQDKIMTTGGEGGMVTTNSAVYEEKMWAFKDHGKSRVAMAKPADNPGFKWIHDTLGSNWRMLEMQAVIGRMQLKQIDTWQQRRQQNAERIHDHVKAYEWLRIPESPGPGSRQAYYKCYVFVEPETLPEGWTRDLIIERLLALGVPAYSGSCSEVYREKAFEPLGCAPAQPLSVAHALGSSSIMFLVHPTLTDSEIQRTCDALSKINDEISRP